MFHSIRTFILINEIEICVKISREKNPVKSREAKVFGFERSFGVQGNARCLRKEITPGIRNVLPGNTVFPGRCGLLTIDREGKEKKKKKERTKERKRSKQLWRKQLFTGISRRRSSSRWKQMEHRGSVVSYETSRAANFHLIDVTKKEKKRKKNVPFERLKSLTCNEISSRLRRPTLL